jgi:hypothetical protein
MTGYALLILPAANRVYAQAAPRLTRAELEVFNRSLLGGRLAEVQETAIAGVPYVTFSADRLGEREVDLLANLSSLYALFEVEGSCCGRCRCAGWTATTTTSSASSATRARPTSSSPSCCST